MPNRPKKNRDRDVLDQRLMREVERLEVALTSQRTAYLAKIEQLSSEVAALTRERSSGALERKYKAALAAAIADKRLFFAVLVRILQNTKVENLGG